MSDASKTVLILGCGLCAPPMIRYLDGHAIPQIVASRTQARVDEVLSGLKHARGVELDVTKDGAEAALEELVPQAAIVVSLLPYIYHPLAARVALRHNKHFFTASYVSAGMEELAEEAEKKQLLMLNECGVDPGLDHMSAQRLVDAVHARGGSVHGFVSLCGGLPAPDANDNPFGYKLSWSPRGVLLASQNNAKILLDGHVKDVPGASLYAAENVRDDHVAGVGDLEWYLNRNSVSYKEVYGLPEVRTLIRGTYRYRGWCETLVLIARFGLNSTAAAAYAGMTYAAFAVAAVCGSSAAEGAVDSATARRMVAATFGVDETHAAMERLAWLGLFDDGEVVPESGTSALDAMCVLFKRRLMYAEGEKDMIVMRTVLDAAFPETGRRETHVSTMVDFGQQPTGDSSMSRTVSLPLGAAVRAMLEDRIGVRGLHRPVIPQLYNPILDEMAAIGIGFEEHVAAPLLWMRAEVKPGEERAPLTPAAVAALVADGYDVRVERAAHRCFGDDAYAAAGAQLVAAGTWPSAPDAAVVIGLKELPADDSPLSHRHVFFGHCFKQQDGWAANMARFVRGGGVLWDMEFLVDDDGRRVAAFGCAAGQAGAAVGLLAWSQRADGGRLAGPVKAWPSVEAMQDAARGAVNGRPVRALVIGALGRCGRGAVAVLEACGVEVTQWDMAETAVGGPFAAMLDFDVVVNCIYLQGATPAFLTPAMLAERGKACRLGVVVDVSCDYNNPHNPIPIYGESTTLAEPVLRCTHGEASLDVVSIDHLPTLIPVEASEAFSACLLPHVRKLKGDVLDDPVWRRAHAVFERVRGEM